MNLSEIVTLVRDILASREAPGDRLWSNASLARFVNGAHGYLFLRRMESNPDYYVEAATLSELGITPGDAPNGYKRYVFPDYVRLVRRITSDHGAGAIQGGDLAPDTVSESTRSGVFRNFLGVFGSGHYFQAGPRTLMVSTEAADEQVVWFAREAPPLVEFAATGGTASSIQGDATSVVLGDRLDTRLDIYKNSRFQVRSAGGAAPESEIATVSASATAYPTVTLTLSGSLTASVEAGDVISSVPLIEDAHHELIAYTAAIRALDSEGNLTHKASIEGTQKQLLLQFIATSEAFQDQIAHYGAYHDRGDT